MDDVIKTTEEFDMEFSDETTHIDGVPVAWLRKSGLGLNPEVPMTGANLRKLGYLPIWTSDWPIDETHGFYRVEVDSRR